MMQKIQIESSSQSAGIVGGGLVGSLLSIYLARRGIESDLYEYRTDMRSAQVGSGRSINLAISVRGLFALREVGLEEQVLKLAIPMRGRMIHSVTGETAFQSYGLSDSECIYSISRSGLNRILLTEAEKTGCVRLHFQKKALGVDPAKCTVSLLDGQTGKETEVTHSVIFGADGSNSVMRNQIAKKEGLVTQETLTHGYKELTLPSGPDQTFLMDRNSLHIWPRGNFMLIALPNLDGSFTCTLFLPFEGAESFESLSSPEALNQFFSAQFPDIRALIPDLEKDFFSNPTGKMTTVKCEQWNSEGRVLLIGDAAHAIVPFFGQGMNCGFEDCTVLNRLLEEEKNWEKVFPKFLAIRKRESDKIADMAVENFIEMRDKVGDPRFLMMKNVEKILQKKFLGKYISRYSLVSFSRVPYSQAYSLGLIQNEILEELCANIGAPEDVDFGKAEALIQKKLAAIMANLQC